MPPVEWPTRSIMHPMLNTAVKAARKAGSIINRASLDVDLVKVASKGRSDFVTEVDRAAEQAIVDILLKAYPDHAILAEESGASGGAPSTRGSSIRSTARPTSSTASRSTRCRSRCGIASTSRRRSCSTPRATNCSPPRAGRGAFLNERRIRVSRRTQAFRVPDRHRLPLPRASSISTTTCGCSAA